MRVPERVMQEGVEGLRVGRFGHRVNTTVIVYRVGGTLIDSGPGNQRRRVLDWAGERPVHRVVLTHHHEDHAGNAAALARAHGAEVLAPAASLALLASGFPVRAYQSAVWGRLEPVQARALPGSLDLGAGLTLRPLPAPGHAADMHVLLVPERGWLFTADLYVAGQVTHLRDDEDVAGQIATLRRILAEDFSTVFCPHRGPLAEGRQALTRKLDWLVWLCGEARRLHQAGEGVEAITRRLLGREGVTRWLTGGTFRKRNLIASCLAAV